MSLTLPDVRVWHEVDQLVGRCLRQLLSDAVDKVGSATVLVPLAAAGLS